LGKRGFQLFLGGFAYERANKRGRERERERERLCTALFLSTVTLSKRERIL
jgi:hypothetical protein